MRKFFLPSALILVLGLAFAQAQNINKAIQLSQDPTGAFGVDTNNNVYFPSHVLSTGPGAPTLTVCGTTPLVTGTDTNGILTEGTAGAGCLVTFFRAYLVTPTCVVTARIFTTLSAINYSTTTAALSITNLTQGNNLVYDYACSSSR